MFRGHFQCIWEKKFKQINFFKSILFDKGQSLTLSKVLCLTNVFDFVFPNNCFLKVLRAFQVTRGHFNYFWEKMSNKVKLCFKALFKVKQGQSNIPVNLTYFKKKSWFKI
jgi:hypothetical protein